MSSLREIFDRDAATYYRDSPDNRIKRGPKLLCFILLSVLTASAVRVASNDFLAGALSAQAILVGFSFNVLFYLVANRLTAPARWTSIDHELRFERLSKLSDEIFDNITYFNIVAICSVVACLVLLLAASDAFVSNTKLAFTALAGAFQIQSYYLNMTGNLARIITLSVLIFLLAESVATFLRAVTRVRFYFTMLKTMNDAAAAASTR